ncbi:MAG: flagellar basal body-associated FliL family protein [Desulfococcaceae bacterium]|jgi:flagellar FliL protein|nr:flagellar basal body-associated FliL family protein [Desulfococcaceae bacterium]
MNKKTVIIMIIVFLLLLFGAVGAGFYFMWGKINDINAKDMKSEVKEKSSEEKTEIGPLVELDVFILNLADTNEQHFLRVKIHLETENMEVSEEVNKRLPQIRDYIISLIPTKTSEEILKAEGKEILRSEMLKGLNGFLHSGRITRLYFNDFVVQ